jgi:hypothetical protein
MSIDRDKTTTFRESMTEALSGGSPWARIWPVITSVDSQPHPPHVVAVSTPSLQFKLDKVKASTAAAFDEEAGAQHHDVQVTFVFGNGHTVRKAFSNGETALGMKKQLFDLLRVDYGKMELEHNGKPLIDPLSICDTPALNTPDRAFTLHVVVPDLASDKWANAHWPAASSH